MLKKRKRKLQQSADPEVKTSARKPKYSPEEVKPYTGPLGVRVKNPVKQEDYPEVAGSIDKYVVDTRIWERVERYINKVLAGSGGDGGGPHTHDIYADKAHEHDLEEHTHELEDHTHELEEHSHELEEHTHDYATSNHTHEGTGGESYDDTAVRGLIQGNTDALAGKSDTGHTHPGGGGGGDYDDTSLRAEVDANTSKNEEQDLRLKALETPPIGHAHYLHGLYSNPGFAQIEAGFPGVFAINKFDAFGNKFVAPEEGDTFTYSVNDVEKSFEVTFVASTATQSVMQGEIAESSEAGDIIDVEVEEVGSPEHTHEDLVQEIEDLKQEIADLWVSIQRHTHTYTGKAVEGE